MFTREHCHLNSPSLHMDILLNNVDHSEGSCPGGIRAESGQIFTKNPGNTEVLWLCYPGDWYVIICLETFCESSQISLCNPIIKAIRRRCAAFECGSELNFDRIFSRGKRRCLLFEPILFEGHSSTVWTNCVLEVWEPSVPPWAF